MKARRPRLGERIAAVESIRAGRATVEAVAREFGRPRSEIRAWMRTHANDHTVSLALLRRELSGEHGELVRQARWLRKLVFRAERTLHVLHAQLLSQKLA